MSYAGLQPQAFLALRNSVKKNAQYITDNEILYPAGAVLILHDYSKQKQRYIPLMDKSIFLEMIIVSPSCSLAAIIINDEKGHIIIYDMKTLKKKKILSLPHDATTRRFEDMCFSYDEKLLLTIIGDPDWLMLSYNWEKGKVETFTRANYINNPGPVSQVLSSPTDSAMCCILGPGLFRLMTMQETVWRQFGFQKADQVTVTSAAFLGIERVLVGTADGRLLLVDSGELKAVHDAAVVQLITVIEKQEGVTSQPVQIPKVHHKDNIDRQVRAITPFCKGFAYSCLVGQVHMFEKDGKNVYKKRNIFTIKDADYREHQQVALNVVQHMSVNPSQDKLLATTNRSQIYSVELWGPSLSSAPEIAFKHLGESLHNGQISGLAMCVWKPLFMTCGAEDRTVRLWNYKTVKLEMVKQYEEDVLSVALHPTALFAAIGFTDKLSYAIVLLDGIQPCRSLPISGCRLSAFSNNGHCLAAVNRFLIIIYSTISFDVVCTLKGHHRRVTSLAWTADDRKLISCGEDGAVYEWDVATGTRTGEVVDKAVSYWECDVTADGNYIYAVGNDGKLKEIRESNVLRVFGLGQQDLPHVVVSRSDLMMFICGDSGYLLSVKMPLIEPIDYKPYLFHNSRVLQIKLTYDDKTLVTVSETGSLCIWDITEADDRAVKIDQHFAYCSDVLIPKADLEDKVARIEELSLRKKELIKEQEYRIKEEESKHASVIQELRRASEEALKELRDEIIKKDKENLEIVNKMSSEISELRAMHGHSSQRMEDRFNAMLIVEYDKIEAARREKEDLVTKYQNKMADIIKEKDDEAERVKGEFLEKIAALEIQVKQLKKENEQERREHAEIKEQIEDDADREIIELKAEYERTLRGERDLYVKVRGEEGVMRKKLSITVKDNDRYKTQIACLQNDLSKSQSDISSLKQDINDLKREIYERDLTIQEKEKVVYDMKKVIEELEKYKFVLSHKIQEIKSQLEPKESELAEKEQQIEQMECEMELMQTANSNMAITIEEHKEKLRTADKQIKQLKEKCDGLNNLLRRLGIDIIRVLKNIQDPKKLKDGIRALNEKYAQSKDGEKSEAAQKDLEDELQRQRDHLQQTVDTLKTALAKARNQPSEGARTVKDNVLLIEEINEQRKLNQTLEEKLERYENILLSSSGKLFSGSEARHKLYEALNSKEAMRREMQAEIDLAKNEALYHREELNRLANERKSDTTIFS